MKAAAVNLRLRNRRYDPFSAETGGSHPRPAVEPLEVLAEAMLNSGYRRPDCLDADRLIHQPARGVPSGRLANT